MATSIFYESGQHGLNVIHDEDEVGDFQVYDVIENIVSELSSKGYSVDSVKNWVDTPRSFDTGLQYAVYNKNGKNVALLEVCSGYYSGANVNIYTGQDLKTLHYEESDVTANKRDIDRVVKCVKMYTDEYLRMATFSNGEAVYETV